METEVQLLKEALEALKWNLNNCHVEKNLQSDLFNINANVISSIENYLNSKEDTMISYCNCKKVWGVGGFCAYCEKPILIE